MRILIKGKWIEPYETFYANDSERFFRGMIGGGFLEVASVMTR